MTHRPPTRLDLGRTALFLDFDGTLVRFHRPDASVPVVDAGLSELLAELHGALGGALAIISGRAMDTLETLFSPLRLPMAGEHGSAWKTSPAGPTENIAAAPSLAAMQDACGPLLARFPAIKLERKPYSLVLHFHIQPALRDEIARFVAALCTPDTGLTMLHARGMVEIKSASVTKGVAVARFLGGAPFAQRTPVFVGDDVTDEDAFVVVNEHQGISIKVGMGSSHARFRLEDEDAVRSWLEGLLGN
ncbi:MAG: trehalose-phosphatase [Rhodocyclaceae bacterium]